MAELFEARIPKDHAVMSEISGTVEYGKDYKAKRRIVVRPKDGGDPVESLVAKGKHSAYGKAISSRRATCCSMATRCRTTSCESSASEALARYLIAEIQEVYRLQGVKIDDKHIEVIARQMLQKVEIVDPAENDFLLGDRSTESSSTKLT